MWLEELLSTAVAAAGEVRKNGCGRERQATMVECLRHAIHIQGLGPHGPGGQSSSFGALTM